VRVEASQLVRFVTAVLTACDLGPDDAARAAELMVAADARGAENHGVFRLAQYVRRIQEGGINPNPSIRVVEDHPSTALLDGDNGMGHLVMSRAAEIAIEKARATGLGWVGARRSNHAGPAALYALMPCAHDMIGMYLAVGSANHMAPWGGTERLLSTNPISIAVPALSRPPVVLDIATSVVAFGQVKSHVLRGEQLPHGWMIDQLGRPLQDPADVHEGSLLPVGGHKGYGLALLIGLLAGTLNGAAFGTDVIDFNADFRSETNTGHSVVALDVASFGDASSFMARVDAVCSVIQHSAPLPGAESVRIPGDRSATRMSESYRHGIAVRPELVVELNGIADQLNVPAPRI
jgi:L-2-hydroxycarboxylate dehydrogenase (NAD+)